MLSPVLRTHFVQFIDIIVFNAVIPFLPYSNSQLHKFANLQPASQTSETFWNYFERCRQIEHRIAIPLDKDPHRRVLSDLHDAWYRIFVQYFPMVFLIVFVGILMFINFEFPN